LLFDSEEEHFDVITNIKGFMATDYFCHKCCGCFGRKSTFECHECSPQQALTKKRRGGGSIEIHQGCCTLLEEGVSKGSEAEIQMLLNAKTGEDDSDIEASGKLEAELRDKINNPRYIIHDFETDTSGEVHVPNLSISQVLKVSGNGSFEPSRVGEQVVFEGYDACDQFCNFILAKENYGSTVIAHNQGEYDGKFILKWLIEHGRYPDKLIRQGNRITYMYIRKNNLRFVR
jgi:hypothetical protein